MTRVAVSLLLFGALLVGCKRKEPPQPAAVAPPLAATDGASTEAPAPAQIAPPPSAAPARSKKPAANQARIANVRGLNGPVHPFMTQQLRIFVQQHGRLPENFTEFTSSRMDSVPRVQEGFRWAVDETTLEVKLVRE